MIYRFQPFVVDRTKFGTVYNQHCSIVPDEPDHWIQITDYDAMALVPEAYAVIDKAIARYPDTAVFGAMTNRVGLNFQRFNMLKLDENDSIKHHMEIARKAAHTYADGQCKEVAYVAGFFMLFRKSYWRGNNFQDRITAKNGILFDWKFCQEAEIRGQKVRVIEGLYMWHTYRLMGNPLSKKHLM